jgi:GNAT superfamily N-acetyltransferase
MAQPSIEIITDEQLEARVASEPENADLFGELPNGRKTTQRLYCVTRQTHGLAEILYGTNKGKRHVVLSLGQRIVAVAGLQVDPRDASVLWVTHVAVEEQHWGNGYGRAIVEAVYPYAIEHGLTVDPSSFSPMGKERIEHIFAELDARYPQAAVRKDVSNAA